MNHDERSTAGVPVRDLIELATRAPSVHNTQPWHWCVIGEGLHCRRHLAPAQSRRPRGPGPDHQLRCRSALPPGGFASGWLDGTGPAHAEHPYNDNQLANVSFRPQEPTPESVAALDALKRRRTDRRRPAARHVPRERLDGLLALGPTAGVTIVAVVSHRARTELLQILAEAQKAQRLRAGEALGAVLVKGAEDGLLMVPLSQAIEVDETRRLLQNELLSDIASPQILVQVGWPPTAAEHIPLTPRRPVDEVIGDVDSLPTWMGTYHD